MVGIYDATDRFARIGEFSSGGVGPHDILLSADGRLLCVANGGIETHPNYGRAKLNLESMRPNLSWLDRDNGKVVATHEVPPELHQLSLRHLTKGHRGRIWAGAQFQGNKATPVPLLVSAGPEDPIEFAALPDEMARALSFYVGSVASSPDGRMVALTSPVGDVAVMLDSETGKASKMSMENVSGVDWVRNGFAHSSGSGVFLSAQQAKIQPGIQFDNHLFKGFRT
jgi:hypothetical protein